MMITTEEHIALVTIIALFFLAGVVIGYVDGMAYYYAPHPNSNVMSMTEVQSIIDTFNNRGLSYQYEITYWKYKAINGTTITYEVIHECG